MLLVYLQTREENLRQEEAAALFENEVFIHNPEMWSALYREHLSDEEVESEDFEWIVPQSEDEVQDLMRKMQAAMGG